MSDSPFIPECDACRLLRALLMFIIGYICFNLIMSDYTTGSMLFSTELKYLNEAILTCIMLTGVFCIGYGAVLVSTLIKPEANEYKHKADTI